MVRGEHYHSQDGKRGGFMRECNYPAWQMIGLEFVGYSEGVSSEDFGVYRVVEPGHPLLAGVIPEAALGQAPGGDLPKAVGHEMDIRIKHLLHSATPPGAELPVEPAGITTLAEAHRNGISGTEFYDYFVEPFPEDLRSEVIYWQRPSGGRVFAMGSIGAGWALSVDMNLQRLLHNVLSHFGVEPRRI